MCPVRPGCRVESLAEQENIMVVASLAGLVPFAAYFALAVVLVVAYLLVYTWITPHDEFALIRANVPGAAIALGASLIGFALPVGSAIAHSANIVDCAIWGVVALIVQLIVYFLARIPDP